MAALYLERYMNFGLTLAELRSGRPIIGIAQTGSDLSPCNRHHIELAVRVRDGIVEIENFDHGGEGISRSGQRPRGRIRNANSSRRCCRSQRAHSRRRP